MKGQRRTARIRALAVSAVTVVAGCAGSAIVSNTYYDVSYVPLEFRTQGTLPVLVRGNPFPVPREVFAQSVADALEGTVFGATTHFVAAPDGSPAPYRIALDFTGTWSGDALCDRRNWPAAAVGAPSAPATAPGGRVRIGGALCRGDKAITNANGSLVVGNGPQSAEFRYGVAQFGIALLPPRNPQNNSPNETFPSG